MVQKKLSIHLFNKSLSPISIKKIYIVIEDKYILNITNKRDERDNEYDIIEPRNIRGFELVYTDIFHKSEIYDGYPKLANAIIETSDNKKIYIKNKKSSLKLKDALSLPRLWVDKSQHGDVVLGKSIKYVLQLFCEGKKIQTTYIHDGGFIVDDINGFNAIPPEFTKDTPSIKKYFNENMDAFGLSERFHVEISEIKHNF